MKIVDVIKDSFITLQLSLVGFCKKLKNKVGNTSNN